MSKQNKTIRKKKKRDSKQMITQQNPSISSNPSTIFENCQLKYISRIQAMLASMKLLGT